MKKKRRKGKDQSSAQIDGRPLPDTRRWQPRDASTTLSSAFAAECKGVEERLLLALQHEKNFAVDAFDSGLPFESIVRNEVKRLLPRRYLATSGKVLDRNGRSAGNCDVVLFNDTWFSPVKSPATDDYGHPFLPIEGIYAIGEVKQTLSSVTLDEAMGKLVKCHRLNRPRTYAHRLVENRENDGCPHGLTNPLFSFIIAGCVSPDESFDSLADRFFYISKNLKRLELPRVLCVLGEGLITWSFRSPTHDYQIMPALFVEEDLFHPVFPTISLAQTRTPFLLLLQLLQQSLFHMILGPEDMGFAYGLDSGAIKAPVRPDVIHKVDQEWLDALNVPCVRKNH